METGVAIGIGLGAVVLVFLLTRQQEQQTAMKIAAIQAQQSAPAAGNGALSFHDVFAVAGTVAATYFGGPSAGSKAATALA